MKTKQKLTEEQKLQLSIIKKQNIAYMRAHCHDPKPEKIGRNDKCPCGSGLKYKKCCLNKDKGYI